MVDNKILSLSASIAVAVSAYVCLLAFLFLVFSNSLVASVVTRYTTQLQEERAIEVVLFEAPQPQILEEKPVVEVKPQEAEGMTPVAGLGISGLFADLNLSAPLKEQPRDANDLVAKNRAPQETQEQILNPKEKPNDKETPVPPTPSRQSAFDKSPLFSQAFKEATELSVHDLRSVQQAVLHGEDSAAGGLQGELDVYYGKVTEIVTGLWEGSPGSRLRGEGAAVTVRVSPSGRILETRILKRSGNPAFDSGVESFLTSLRSVKLPEFARGGAREIGLTLKNKSLSEH